jgi:hypothetical protein
MARAAAAQVDDDDSIEQPDETVRDALESARDEVVAREEARADEQAGRAQPAPGGEARPRDEAGRFVPGGETKPAADATQPAAGATAAPSGATKPAAEPAAQPGAAPAVPGAAPSVALAPQSWSQAAKAEWTKLSPLVREQIAQREADTHRELTKQDGERALARQFTQIVNGHQDVLNVAGVHPLRFMDDVMKVMRTLQFGAPEQRIELLRGIAARNGIDFRALIPQGSTEPRAPDASGAAPAPSPSFQLPPELQRMSSEWNTFKQTQANERARQEQEARAAQERMAQTVMTEIESFRAQPQARFFDQVRDHMTVLLSGGAANTLAEAYDMAIHARPDIRAVLEKEAADAARAEAEKQARARNARVRSGSVRGGTGSTTPKPAQDRSLREELEANFAEARSRL